MARQSQYSGKVDPILNAIAAFLIENNGRPPSVRDLASATDTSVATLHSYLRRMAEEGLVSWHPKTHRSITLTPQGRSRATVQAPF